jgi:hypothetical protein
MGVNAVRTSRMEEKLEGWRKRVEGQGEGTSVKWAG